MDSQQHWQHIYQQKSANSLSWYQSAASQSMVWIKQLALPLTAPILDVGAGAGTLVDDLLQAGYQNLQLLDLADSAFTVTKTRIQHLPGATAVRYLTGDLLKQSLPEQQIMLWHDRAVLHFFTEEPAQQQYVRQLLHSVAPGGYAMIATFAEDGPITCSGLPVQRYSLSALQQLFAPHCRMLDQCKQLHLTPAGREQQFQWVLLQKN